MLTKGRIGSALFACVLISSALFWKNRVGEGNFISSAADYCQFVIPAPGRFKPQRCGSGEQEEMEVGNVA